MAQKSVMKHNFSQIPSISMPRSSFDRSHGHKTTFNSGTLVPFYVDEALPGDTFNAKHTIFARMTTPITPIMDNLHQDTFYFAVPIRLIWDNWQRFNGEQDNPDSSTDYLIPQQKAPLPEPGVWPGGYPEQGIADYMGIPTKIPGLEHSALFHRAYKLIWNEWFRDQNLQESIPISKGDGPDVLTSVFDDELLRRNKRHDYFTSALPWPQKGPSVAVPTGGQLEIFGNDKALQFQHYNAGVWNFGNLRINADGNMGLENQESPYFRDLTETYSDTNKVKSKWLGFPTENQTDIHGYTMVDAVSNAYASTKNLEITVNALRESFQLQKMFERDARGGTRYTEILRSHFGVVSPDARLQRSEYLGGSTSRVNIVPVQQTSATDATSPQGNLAAFGVINDSSNGFNKSFTEHCIIIGLLNVRADLTYQQGMNRMFSRRTRFDFYWPSLAHLGEQTILNKEIFTQGTAEDNEPFGYQERFAEYRYKPSLITGLLNSNSSLSLDVWHLSQDFEGLPQLNSQFIEERVPMDRILAVTNQPEFIADIYMQLKTARPMPTYSVPGLIDHF